jgi:hypothetical protein
MTSIGTCFMNTKHEHSTRKIGGTEKENWWDCPLKIKGKKGKRGKGKKGKIR